MNKTRLNMILDNYMRHFPGNAEDGAGLECWTAAAVWKKNWDPDATDFLGMLRKASSRAIQIINTQRVQPLSGMVRLCITQNGRYAGEVRALFRELYADAEDMERRQTHMEAFITKANGLIELAYPGAFHFAQDRRSAAFYLGLCRPETDWLLKYTAVRNLADFVGFEEPIEPGSAFSLAACCRLCEAVAEAVEERKDLLDAVDSALRALAEKEGLPEIETVDACHHLLAYDILVRTDADGFYEAHPVETENVRRPVTAAARSTGASTARTRTGSAAPRKSAKAEAAEAAEAEVRAKIKALEDEAALLQQKLDAWEFPDLVGTQLTHVQNGEGTVEAQSGDRLTIRYAGGATKRQSLTALVTGNFLVSADPALTSRVLLRREIEQQLEAIRNRRLAVKVPKQ